nr:DUF664 domain-containing protein [Propionibacterium sp.]
MNANEILIDAARRPVHAAEQVLAGIDPDTLHALPDGRGNSIAWLLWHAARQQDAQVAHLGGTEQVWVTGGWAERLGVDRGPRAIGFGDSLEEVAALRVAEPRLLHDYLAAVVESVVGYIGGLTEDELGEVIDTSWDPPVTRGVRLVSTIDDAAVHVGQAAYARGLLAGWRIGY